MQERKPTERVRLRQQWPQQQVKPGTHAQTSQVSCIHPCHLWMGGRCGAVVVAPDPQPNQRYQELTQSALSKVGDLCAQLLQVVTPSKKCDLNPGTLQPTLNPVPETPLPGPSFISYFTCCCCCCCCCCNCNCWLVGDDQDTPVLAGVPTFNSHSHPLPVAAGSLLAADQVTKVPPPPHTPDC